MEEHDVGTGKMEDGEDAAHNPFFAFVRIWKKLRKTANAWMDGGVAKLTVVIFLIIVVVVPCI